jgi:hypothetical protein
MPRCRSAAISWPRQRRASSEAEDLALAAAAVLVVATATGGVVVMSSAEQATPTPQESPANTEKVERGKLSDRVPQAGILTFRAQSDGSPYAAINQTRGVYTKLPDVLDRP